MTYLISTVRDDLAGVFHGTTIDRITNIYGIHNRTARQLLLDCDPIETKRIATLPQVFNSIYDYASPSDLKGTRILDVRPQAGRNSGEQWEQAFARWFDANKGANLNNAFNIQHNTGVKSLRLEAPGLPSPIALSDTGTLADWAGGNTATNLSLDQTFNVAGGGAIQFDQTANGYVEAVAVTPIDLTAHLNLSTLFCWVYMPTVLTSVDLRWGDSSTSYWNYTATTRADATAFQVGWNLCAFPWASATKVGSPLATTINYLRVTTTGGAMFGLKIDNIVSIQGKYLEALYYSKYLYSLNGIWKETVADDATDLNTTINLDTESYNLYFNLLCYFITQQLQGGDMVKDAQFFMQEYQKCLKRYTAMYKSEALIVSEPYYQTPSRRGFYGGSSGPRWHS